MKLIRNNGKIETVLTKQHPYHKTTGWPQLRHRFSPAPVVRTSDLTTFQGEPPCWRTTPPTHCQGEKLVICILYISIQSWFPGFKICWASSLWCFQTS